MQCFEFKKHPEMLQEAFINLKTRNDIVDLLEIRDKTLRYFLYKVRPDNMYYTFKIKKKNGAYREINAPDNRLKFIQRKLAYILNLVYKPKICANGFVQGKCIVDNAKPHIKKRNVFNIDLKDFFTQIDYYRVRGLFMSKPYEIPYEAATVLAQIICYKGAVPQGAPTSPIVTNLICRTLDTQLMGLAKKYRMTYTRYADDITFSTTNKTISNNIVVINNNKYEIGEELKQILLNNKFEVNPNKIFLNSRQTRQEVTGLIVNEKVNVKREYYKTLRAILNNCEKKGILFNAKVYIEKGYCKNKDYIKNKDNKEYEEKIYNWFHKVLRGKLNYLSEIKGKDNFAFLKLAKQYNNLFSCEEFNVASLNLVNKYIENVFVVISENETNQGTGFILKDYGLITSAHVIKNEEFYKVIKSDNNERKCVISKKTNLLKYHAILDYALFNYNDNKEAFIIGDSSNLKLQEQVTIIGFPEFVTGTPYVDTCTITQKKMLYGSETILVSGRIGHGASGGMVLNKSHEVIGLIKAGFDSLDEDLTKIDNGFVPIHIVLDDINKQKEYVLVE